MYVCILHINNTKKRTHTESFMDGWFWTSAMSLQVFKEKKNKPKAEERRQIQATRQREREREREREGNTKQTNKESLPQERK
jgi:hypothetical protein